MEARYKEKGLSAEISPQFRYFGADFSRLQCVRYVHKYLIK